MSLLASKIATAFLLIHGFALGQKADNVWDGDVKAAELRPRLETTLEKAPLTKRQHADILAALADKTFTESYSEEDLPAAKLQLEKTSLGMHVAGERSPFVVLEGAPGELRCGATGNCPIWIFIPRGAGFALVLEAGGWGLIVQKKTSHGLPNLAVTAHLSASETSYFVYQFDGSQYKLSAPSASSENSITEPRA
jgi:hypothetical protein